MAKNLKNKRCKQTERAVNILLEIKENNKQKQIK